MRTLFLYLVLFFFASNEGSGQAMIRQITLDDGLSDIQCFDVFQDSKGYLWIGTRAGICKYDGRDLLTFDRSDGLLSDHIYSFYEDNSGRIWMVNLNGEPMFIVDNEVHSRISDSYLSDLKSTAIHEGICEDENGRIWFVDGTNEVRILDNEKVIRLMLQDSIYNDIMAYGVFSIDNEIVIATNRGMRSYGLESLDLIWKADFETVKSIHRKSLLGDRIFFFEYNKGYYFDLKTKKIHSLDLDLDELSLHESRVLDGRHYLSTSKGVYELQDSQLVKLNLGNEIDENFISAFLIDTNGNSWVSTNEDGVYGIISGEVDQSLFNSVKGITYLVHAGPDSIHIGNKACQFSIWNKEGLVEKIQMDEMSSTGITQALKCDEELWIMDSNSFHMDVKEDYSKFDLYKRDVIYNPLNQKFYCINDKGLMVISKSFMQKSKTNQFQNSSYFKNALKTGTDGFYRIPIIQPYNCSVDSTGIVWVGSELGISYVNDTIVKSLNHPKALGSIVDMLIDDHHLLGINYGKGVFDYDIEKDTFFNFDKTMGLPTNYLINLAADRDDIWVTYVKGICHLKRTEFGLKLVKIYGQEHGIPKGHISLISVIDNVCHFKIGETLYAIKSKSVMDDTLRIVFDEEIEIGYTDDQIDITYDCINLFFAKEMLYEYRLLPLDSSWIETVSEKISFQYLPSSEYTLEMRAKHPLKLPSPISRKMIYIKNRWFESKIFFTLFSLSLFSLIFFLIRIKALSFNAINIKFWLKDYLFKTVETSVKIKDIKGAIQILEIKEMVFIKASGNYIEFQMDKDQHTSRMSITSAEALFKTFPNIKRVHRSYMVNFSKITAVDHKLLKLSEYSVPYSKTYKGVITEHLGK